MVMSEEEDLTGGTIGLLAVMAITLNVAMQYILSQHVKRSYAYLYADEHRFLHTLILQGRLVH
ncbi:hypothetical protein GCM10011450_21030 [Advenella faeciporci]|uniref:Uncharacterized protein n=1 Tax=Advenella faeciporci TaxID=797535 RepID=A0A918JN01_9BURK|nr:hypothetical protein GCM10011450_21030 [Advenella faeciporci]